MGTPNANTASSTRGEVSPNAESGPPERITPTGANARIADAGVSYGRISL